MSPVVDDTKPRWLLLIHQLPPTPAYLRVKTARQLQKIGAVALKNSVYVLPNSDAAHESFAWIAREIAAQRGESSLCASSFVDGTPGETIEALFNAARGRDYQDLAADAREALRALGRGARLAEERRQSAAATLGRLRRRADEIAAIDFFGASAGEAARSLLDALEARTRAGAETPAATETRVPERPHGATWVTRQGVHVDRIASAWLIRRFIDEKAVFKFVPAKGHRHRAGERRFDMFEAEYTHEGDRCTFEVLSARFRIADPGVATIAEIVHDLDVRDGKFARAETPGIEALITGICLTQTDDDARIAAGSVLLDGLCAAFKRRRR